MVGRTPEYLGKKIESKEGQNGDACIRHHGRSYAPVLLLAHGHQIRAEQVLESAGSMWAGVA